MKIWIPIVCALILVQACKTDEDAEEKRLTFTDVKSQVEEQNLKAVCEAADEIADIEGVQDRMSRIAEIAVLTSPTTELVDGLTGLEGHERLPL
ncbi:MAG TPA: hypothetical protein EYN66_09590, partial [Myxococcales bacterium]|nr:hypothetical protein [Myxococcales bacterium]